MLEIIFWTLYFIVLVLSLKGTIDLYKNVWSVHKMYIKEDLQRVYLGVFFTLFSLFCVIMSIMLYIKFN